MYGWPDYVKASDESLAPNLEARRPFGDLVRAAHADELATIDPVTLWGAPYKVTGMA